MVLITAIVLHHVVVLVFLYWKHDDRLKGSVSAEYCTQSSQGASKTAGKCRKLSSLRLTLPLLSTVLHLNPKRKTP